MRYRAAAVASHLRHPNSNYGFAGSEVGVTGISPAVVAGAVPGAAAGVVAEGEVAAGPAINASS